MSVILKTSNPAPVGAVVAQFDAWLNDKPDNCFFLWDKDSTKGQSGSAWNTASFGDLSANGRPIVAEATIGSGSAATVATGEPISFATECPTSLKVDAVDAIDSILPTAEEVIVCIWVKRTGDTFGGGGTSEHKFLSNYTGADVGAFLMGVAFGAPVKCQFKTATISGRIEIGTEPAVGVLNQFAMRWWTDGVDSFMEVFQNGEKLTTGITGSSALTDGVLTYTAETTLKPSLGGAVRIGAGASGTHPAFMHDHYRSFLLNYTSPNSSAEALAIVKSDFDTNYARLNA